VEVVVEVLEVVVKEQVAGAVVEEQGAMCPHGGNLRSRSHGRTRRKGKRKFLLAL
jgi:hypothetical protein